MEIGFTFKTGKDKTKAVKLAGVTAQRGVQSDLGDMVSSLSGGERAPNGKLMERKDPDIAFDMHVWVRFGIEKIAIAAGMFPLAVTVVDPDRQDDEELKAKIKKVQKLLNNPNEFDGRMDWMVQTTIDLALLRAAATEITRWQLDGSPAALYALPARSIRVNLDKSGRLASKEKAFTQIVDGQDGQSWSLNDMLFFRLLPKTGQFISTSPIATLRNALLQDGYAVKFNMDNLRNGNTVRQILAIGDETGGGPDAGEVQAEWDKKHGDGQGNRRLTFISGAKVTAIPIDGTLEDMQWTDQQKYCVRQVSTAFGIPLIYFGWPDDTKYANAEAEEKRFAAYTVLPIVTAICDKLNQYLLPQFGLDPDEDAMVTPSPELLAITELDLRREEKDQRTGVYTVNDIRRKRGEGELDWGDDYMFNGTAFIPVPGTEAAQEAADAALAQAEASKPEIIPPGDGNEPITQGPAGNKPSGKPPAPKVAKPAGAGEEQGPQPQKSISNKARRAHIGKYMEAAIKGTRSAVAKLLIRPLTRGVKAMAAQIRALSQEQLQALAAGAEAGIERPITRRKLLDFYSNLDLGESMDEIAIVLEEGFKAGYSTGRSVAGSAFGIKATMREPVISVVDSMKPAWKEVGAKMEKALIKDAQDILIDGLANGMTSGQIADELVKNILGDTMREDGRIVFHDGTDGQRAYSMTPENWAEVTAQTNVTRAANLGIQESLKDAGVTQRQWRTMEDDRVREEHAAVDGEIRGMDEPFSNGEMNPGDAPNCRCWQDIPDEELARLGYDITEGGG